MTLLVMTAAESATRDSLCAPLSLPLPLSRARVSISIFLLALRSLAARCELSALRDEFSSSITSSDLSQNGNGKQFHILHCDYNSSPRVKRMESVCALISTTGENPISAIQCHDFFTYS
ncbi:hypothetical protein MPTK1_7g04630 [Marchantia polymorpha subsp. ruderalis]|uniref:Uncharacterized protein n=2 Tax=Marchantia polymorpha TaxID=3197 RepID=A0AAF6BW54_MARPO|nr:hypothetical protein MARPO_0062s0063 [Marchantia polymorpha]BBN16238.1 hypothetical protein Mp_7g04630 [Marchantia polymorpha subsp. ruderalis]|eukprot:PTQ36644.1 hypothetical protein MARPO_0062s0063 [Marchantia polymorpha]